MRRSLARIREHPDLRLSIFATGMHTLASRGRSLRDVVESGFDVAGVIPWRHAKRASQFVLAQETGRAISKMAEVFTEHGADVVLIVGDRVEAFAAASAAHLLGLTVAHVHGGDVAEGQVDDALRHAITKLSHEHFAATPAAGERIRRLGEPADRVHIVGSPGIEGIEEDAEPLDRTSHRVGLDLSPQKYVLVLLHPVEADDDAEHARAGALLDGVRSASPLPVVLIGPNNDPGGEGILRRWTEAQEGGRVVLADNLPRSAFLALLRDARALAGNSSSGIIEAASFGTPVVDVGTRQRGRQTSGNVRNVEHAADAITAALSQLNGSRPRVDNVYARTETSKRIADRLAAAPLDPVSQRKRFVD